MSRLQNLPRLREYYAISEINFRNELRTIRNGLSKNAWLVATLGISKNFYKKWRYIPRDSDIQDQDAYLNKWEDLVRILTTVWSMSCLGRTLLAPLSVALLQIDSVHEASFGRTVTIAAFIFSAAGLLLSAVFMSTSSHLDIEKCQDRWFKASETFENPESVRMWSLFVFPLSALIWSMIFCLVTMLVQLAWNIQSGASDIVEGASRIGNIISGTFLMALTSTLMVPLWRGILLVKELC